MMLTRNNPILFVAAFFSLFCLSCANVETKSVDIAPVLAPKLHVHGSIFQARTPLPYVNFTLSYKNNTHNLQSNAEGGFALALPWRGPGEVLFMYKNPIGDQRSYRMWVSKAASLRLDLEIDENGSIRRK